MTDFEMPEWAKRVALVRHGCEHPFGALDPRATALVVIDMQNGFMVREGVTDLVLLGEERPYHRDAITAATARGIDVYVVEMGYLRPDWITLEGGSALSGSVVADRDLGLADEQPHRPERVAVKSIPGQGYVTVRSIATASGPFTVTVDREKGGIARGRSGRGR